MDEKEAKEKKEALEARIADLNKKIDEENKQQEKKLKRIEKDLKTAKKKSGPRGGLGQPLFLKERLRPCGEILNVIMQHEHAEIFKREVDRKIYPHYYTKIKNPMWLNKVKSKLYSDQYKTEIEFQKEMSQVWINA
jgi:vacuolar-type H+-ATPase subunit D/Vma8